MLIPVRTQLYYFITTIAAGLIVGIMFDSYRSIRSFKKPNRLMEAISDIMFWILVSLIIFTFFMYTNNAAIRYYTFIGIFIGAIIYLKIISKKVLGFMRFFLYYLIKAIRFFVQIIILPFRLLKFFALMFSGFLLSPKSITVKFKRVYKRHLKKQRNKGVKEL